MHKIQIRTDPLNQGLSTTALYFDWFPAASVAKSSSRVFPTARGQRMLKYPFCVSTILPF